MTFFGFGHVSCPPSVRQSVKVALKVGQGQDKDQDQKMFAHLTLTRDDPAVRIKRPSRFKNHAISLLALGSLAQSLR